MDKTLNVGELRQLIQESSNEFKARIESGVESGNKTNAGKAYKNGEENRKKMSGNAKGPQPVKYEKKDGNKTTLDVVFDNEVDDSYKKRVAAQAKGYTSADEEKNKIEKSGEYSNNAFNGIKDCGETMQDNKKKMAHVGLTSVHTDDGKKPNSLYENKVKTAYFKKTTFLSENHMFSRIPDEFKNEGCQFKMKDKTNNEYLIEWSDNRPNILEHNNPEGCKQSLDEMKRLFNYNPSDRYTRTTQNRINESEEGFINTLNNARKCVDNEN